nr:hypothetical protein [uncultured Draconibacterium sp.]
MGRYDHLKVKKEIKKSKLKMVREIITVIVFALVISGFILQIVMQFKK